MEHFDAVVVGSGFGGSVTAYRLAEAGWSVCVLERGRAYPPNSFPRSPALVADNFWDPSAARYGLFDMWSFSGLESLVSAGLGGGSLIYANVLLRKDEKWFMAEDFDGGYRPWPVSRADLDPHYDRVEKMLDPHQYPFDVAPYSETPKTIAFQEAADKLGLDWQLPPLAITFANSDGPPVPGEPIHEQHRNLHDRTRYTCRLCGECDVGCNYGSKNTLDFNYLSEAKRHGAAIRPLSTVRRFQPRDGGGFEITYVQHDPDTPREKTGSHYLDHLTMTADHLILGAGTYGSTFLLLKNRAQFPNLSTTLGTRFSDNGDLLSFIIRSRRTVAGKTSERALMPDHGPVITSAVRIPDELDGDGAPGRGFYIEDAGYPTFASWILQEADVAGTASRFLRFAGKRMWDRFMGSPQTNLGGEMRRLIGDCDISATTMPMLGMGRDVPDGVMSLTDGFLELAWKMDASKPYFEAVRDQMHQMADVLEGDFVDNPLWYLHRMITVHPLGGVPMGRDATEGVVDSYGDAFDYPGLHVVDGSIMPSPVGANPSLTIAAMADRCADHMIEGAAK